MEEREEERTALLQLCQRSGIGTEYHDIWGRRRRVPAHGLRALLRAMGIEAGNREQVLASLRIADAVPATPTPLPPVTVFWEDEAPHGLTLLAAARDSSLIWDLVEEGGARHAGRVVDYRVVLPPRLPIGYHRLDLRVETAAAGLRLFASTLLIVAPRRCYLPPALREGRRAWGPAVQLYAVRSERNWGMGDFTDLAQIVRRCGRDGASVVGLNPLHALYPHNPGHASPYAPSSRRFRNVLYIDVEAVEEFRHCLKARAQVAEAQFQDRLRHLRSLDQVDYAGVAAVKMGILERLHAWFHRAAHKAPQLPRAVEFRAFQAAGGPALRQHALFEALQEHFHRENPAVWGWPVWPYEYRDPDAQVVAEFARAHAERIEFFEYLQWQAEVQLAAASAPGPEERLAVGLYQDLAVSVDRGGADSWGAQDLYAQGASAGCPPDDFNLHGQDWGLLPLLPERLRARAYAPFIAVLRANMRHSGALRIDHVMGLSRLFWVPRGDLPEAGGYVHYPFEHLLAILTLESERNRCMVIGEDLGTVSDEVRHAMDRSGVLSYRVLYFSRGQDGEFFAPRDFPVEALVTSSTHDLATLAGYWEGRDLALRESLGLFPSESLREQQVELRKADRVRLLRALQREGLLPSEAGTDPNAEVPMTRPLAIAIQEYLARAPSRILVVQLEDIFSCPEQVNLPGTVDQYANWRRKLPVALERWDEDGRFAEFAGRILGARPVG